MRNTVATFKSEDRILKAIGLDFNLLNSGCCGMAGSFGFEAEKYEVSQKCGERVLLPKVREAGKETLVLADGFSCKTQIEESTGRQGLHLAQVLQMAKREGIRGPKGKYPERGYTESEVTNGAPTKLELALLGGLASGAAAIWLSRR